MYVLQCLAVTDYSWFSSAFLYTILFRFLNIHQQQRGKDKQYVSGQHKLNILNINKHTYTSCISQI